MREANVAAPGVSALADLARVFGVQPTYFAITGEERTAPPESIVAILRLLGAPVERMEDAADALWEREQELALKLLDPITVVWQDRERIVRPRILRSETGSRLECTLETEAGETHEWAQDGDAVVLPEGLEAGYHTLSVTLGGRRAATTRLLVAPPRAHDPTRRSWGVFLPLYALRTRRSWGTGDFGDLERLVDWTAGLGGSAVGTLPLLSTFLSAPFDPSPYAPVSRLFWNELYVDVDRAPELARSSEARALLDNRELQSALRELRRSPFVDYRAAYPAKRRVLEALARTFFASPEWRSDDFLRFLADHPEAQGYASFRATCELWNRPWHQWPPRLRQGSLQEGDYPQDVARYHLYGQYLAMRQLGTLAETGRAQGAELYLDLPLGVHPDGYDAWRFQELFVPGVGVGAPPDDFFEGGQDWGFRPLHPERIREDGYRYVIASVRNLCRHAGLVRLDHVMALHRLYWIPPGAPATDGVYVRYPADELWAVLTIESNRWRSAIVGEDLGTVPPEVRAALDRHAARRMYVAPFELREDPTPRFEPVPERSVASVNTHDMPTFFAWWRDAGENRRRAFAIALAAAGHPIQAGDDAAPSERARGALAAALRMLAASPARLALVNLEDLWLEDEPQNVPGTAMAERPNWSRKARYALEMFREFPEVLAILRDVDRLRRGG